MSRILRNKKILALIAVVLGFTTLWPISVLIFTFIAIVFFNRRLINYNHLPLKTLHNRTEIKEIETLIIGDYCSKKELAAYTNGETLSILHPGRTLEASYMIFQHTESMRMIHRSVKCQNVFWMLKSRRTL